MLVVMTDGYLDPAFKGGEQSYIIVNSVQHKEVFLISKGMKCEGPN